MISHEEPGFEYYRRGGYPPFPRSLSTALRSYQNGQSSLEPAVFRAGSVDSIFQEPLNVHLVLELLANSEVDHTVNHNLAAVLFSNLNNEDREVADFAAQALARLEERYYRRIHQAEKEYREATATEARLERAEDLCELYAAFAEIQQFNAMLREYYFRKVIEIAGVVCDTTDSGCRDSSLLQLRIRALVGIGSLDAAELELRRSLLIEVPAGLWLQAEIEFERRNVVATAETVRMVHTVAEEFGVELPRTQQQIVHQWVGRDSE